MHEMCPNVMELKAEHYDIVVPGIILALPQCNFLVEQSPVSSVIYANDTIVGVSICTGQQKTTFKRNVNAFSLNAIVDVRRRHEKIF